MSQIQEPAGTLQERRGVKTVLGTVGPGTRVLPAGTAPRQCRLLLLPGVATAQSLGSFPKQAELRIVLEKYFNF